MDWNDDAARIVGQRRAQEQQQFNTVRKANLATAREEVRANKVGVAARLRAANYPENDFFAMCWHNGRQIPVWVIALGDTEQAGYWAGVMADGSLVSLYGTSVDRSYGRLQVQSELDIYSSFFDRATGIPAMRSIAHLLETCDRQKYRPAWKDF